MASAQVGINTNLPNAKLDVNGDMTIREKIYLGGTEGTLGDPGVDGQVLVSQGPGLPPEWLTLNIPEPPDEDDYFFLIYNNTFEDQTGVTFTSGETTGNTTYAKGTALSTLTSWKLIPGFSQEFEVFSDTNRTYVTFETVAQMGTTGAGNLLDAVDFACGIFIDGKLEGVRVNTVEQPSTSFGPFRTITMFNVSKDVPSGTHTIDVACTRRANYSTTSSLGIGTAVNTTNLNNFMAKSTLKVEVFEIPEGYILIDP